MAYRKVRDLLSRTCHAGLIPTGHRCGWGDKIRTDIKGESGTAASFARQRNARTDLV